MNKLVFLAMGWVLNIMAFMASHETYAPYSAAALMCFTVFLALHWAPNTEIVITTPAKDFVINTVKEEIRKNPSGLKIR